MARSALAAGVAVVVLAWAARPARGQDGVRASAAFNRQQVAVGDMVAYTVTLSSDAMPAVRTAPQPDFSAFEVAAGPSSGQSSEIRFVNGAVSRRENLTLSWRLVPKAGGIASVPGFAMAVGGQQVAVPRAEIEVVAAGQATQPPAGGLPPWGSQAPGRARSDGRRPWPQETTRPGDGVSLRTEISDTSPWVGQVIRVRDVLTFDQNVSSFREVEAPEFAGFARKRNEGIKPEGHRVQDPATREIHSEATLAEWAITPLTPGRKELTSHSYVFTIPSRDPIEAMWGRQHDVQRDSTPPVVEVRALPDGAPASFGGSVGTFQFDARLAASSLKTGDGTQLVVTIRGRGSFEGVKAPDVVLPEAIKSFDPEVVERVEFDPDGQLHGTKTFTYPLLVTQAGVHVIAAMSWAYFDPQTGRYVERATDALRLEAIGGEAPLVVGTPMPVSTDVEVKGTDIRHVRGTLGAWHPDLAASGVPRWLFVALVLGPMLNVGVAGAGLLSRLRRSDPATRRAQEAASSARRRIAEAASALAGGKAVEAADAASRAISGLVSDRLGLGVELAPAEAGRAVEDAGHADLARRVERFLSDCDFARFASAGAGDVPRLLDEARALLPLVADLEASQQVA